MKIFKLKFFAVFFFLFLTASIGVLAATKTYNAGGSNNVFSNKNRWSGGTLPSAGDNLIINAGICSFDNLASSVVYGTITLQNGATLTWPSLSTKTLMVSNVIAGPGGGGIISMSLGGTLSFSGTWASTGITFTAGTGTIISTGVNTFPSSLTAFNNLSVTGTGSVTTSNPIICTGNLIVSGGGTLNTSSSNWSITVSGNLSVSAGSVLTANASSIYVAKTYSNNGTMTAGAHTVILNGTTSQLLGGTAAFYNLTLAGTADTTTLSSAILCNGDLSISPSNILNTSTNSYGLIVKGKITIKTGSPVGGLKANASTIDIGGDWLKSGSFTAGSSTVNFNGTAVQNIGGSITTAFNNLKISNTSAAVTSTTNCSVGGTLTINSGAILNPSALNTIGGSGTLTGSGTAMVKLSTGSNDFTSQYTITNKTLTNLTVEFAGASAQGSGTPVYGNLKINNAAGLSLGANAHVKGVLTLSNGNITTSVNKLTIDSFGSVSRVSGHVIGRLEKSIADGSNVNASFEVGTGSDYTPVNVSFASVSGAGKLTVNSTATDHPNISTSNLASDKTINRYWTLNNSGIVFSSYGAIFNFVSSDMDAGVDTSYLEGRSFSGGNWSTLSTGNLNASSAQFTNLTGFGDFQIGEYNIPSYLPQNGLVGWYPFNGNANDESRNGNNGSVNGSLLTTDRFGNASNAYSFNGINNYISANNSLINSPNEFSISAWMWLDSSASSKIGDIVTSWPKCGDQFNLRYDTYQGNFTISLNTHAFCSVPFSNYSNWVFVAFTTKRNDYTNLYINGNLVSQMPALNSVLACSNFINIGREENGGGSSYFTGNLDDIGVWNRALSSNEVSTMYYGCTSPSSSITPQDTTTFCSGGFVNLKANTGDNYLYQWYLDGNAISNATASLYKATKGGSYTLAVGDSACKAKSTVSASVSISLLPLVGKIAAINGPASVCIGGTGTYFIPSVANATNYVWTVPVGSVINSGQGTPKINVTFGSLKGSVCVTGSNICGTTIQSCKAVTIGIPASAASIKGPTNLCVSGNTGLTYSVLAVSGATSYTWSVPANASIVSGLGTKSIVVDFINSLGGNICVMATNSCGSSSQTCLTVLGTNPSASNLIVGSSNICFAGSNSVAYSIPAVAAANNYTWTLPANANIVAGQGTVNASITFDNAFSSGQICVQASNLCASSAPSCKTITKTPAVPGSISGSQNLCAAGGGNQTYSISAIAGSDSSIWTVPANASIVSGQGTNSIVVSFDQSFVSGSICVVGKNSCGSSTSKCLTVSTSLLGLGSISGALTACSGQTGVSYTVPALSGATSYLWTLPTGSKIASGAGTNSIMLDFGSVSGDICVSASNSCGSTAQKCKAVVVNVIPASPSSISGLLNICSSSSANLDYSVTPIIGATSYAWTVPAGASIVSGQGTSALKVGFGGNAGSLCVSASNSCGSSTPKCITLNNAAPSATSSIIGSSNVCYAGISNVSYSVGVTAGAGSYNWTVPSGASIAAGQGTNALSVSYSNSFVSGLICVSASNYCGTPGTQICKLISDAPVIYNKIIGSASASTGTSATYSISAPAGALSYLWVAPAGTVILAGQGTNSISLSFTGSFAGGSLCVTASNTCGTSTSQCLPIILQ